MLATDGRESGGAQGFSLAGDIVELLVLTTDVRFLRTLREAVGGGRRVWHVPSADKVSDLLVAGQVGILVVDGQALHEVASRFVSQIKRQFPDLIVVAAGVRDDETALAHLISMGLVYRFIHKPLSPGRARSFANAAVRKYVEQRERLPPPLAVKAFRRNPQLLLGGVLLCTALLVLAIFVTRAFNRDGVGSAASPSEVRGQTNGVAASRQAAPAT